MTFRSVAHGKIAGRDRRRLALSSSSPSRSRSRSFSPRRRRLLWRHGRDRDVDRRRRSPPSRDHDWDGQRGDWNRGDRGRDEDRHGHGGSKASFALGPSSIGLGSRGRAGVSGRGSADQCYVCGGYGHWARNCSSKASLYRGTSSRAYSPPTDRSAEPPKCFECGKFGHVARECTFRQTGAIEQRCYECNSIGHIARECPAKGRGRFAFPPQVGAREHMSFAGPPRSGSMANGCYHCGQPGHFARECPQKGGGSAAISTADRWMGGMMGNLSGPAGLPAFNHGFAMMGGLIPGAGGGCYECGQPGHFARECNVRRQRLETKRMTGIARGSSRRVSGEVRLDTDLDTYMKEKRDRLRQGDHSSDSEDEEHGHHDSSADGGDRNSEDQHGNDEGKSDDCERDKPGDNQPMHGDLGHSPRMSNGQAEGNGKALAKGEAQEFVKPKPESAQS